MRFGKFFGKKNQKQKKENLGSLRYEPSTRYPDTRNSDSPLMNPLNPLNPMYLDNISDHTHRHSDLGSSHDCGDSYRSSDYGSSSSYDSGGSSSSYDSGGSSGSDCGGGSW